MSAIFENESYISAMDTFLSNLFEIMYVMFFIMYISNILYSQHVYSQIYKDKFWEIYVDINEAYSRKSIEDFEEINNNENSGHWVFWSGKSNDPQFQATNCVICGEYEISNTINAPRCKCNKEWSGFQRNPTTKFEGSFATGELWCNMPRNIDSVGDVVENDGYFYDDIDETNTSDDSFERSCNIVEHKTKRRRIM
jgi:hypothetical protein